MMLVSLDLRCFISSVFLLLMNRVSAQNVRVVNGTLGRTIVLPCSDSQSTQTVFWRYHDSTTVCDIIKGEVKFVEQDPVYEGRVEVFPSEFVKGNFSIKLHDLRESDAGIYTCNFPHRLTPATVQLRVTENSSGDVLRRPDSLLLFLLGGVLLINCT